MTSTYQRIPGSIGTGMTPPADPAAPATPTTTAPSLDGSCVISDASLPPRLIAADNAAALSDTAAQAVAAGYTDISAIALESLQSKVSGPGPSDASAAPSEAGLYAVRYWGSAATDNDQSRTTPANAIGANNGTVATLKTTLQALDTTNPVTLTGSGFGAPSSGTYTAKRVRVYFSVTAAPGSDTLTLSYNVGAGDVVIFTASAAVNNLASGLAFDVSSLTMAQVAAMTLKASYQAAVVLTPSSSLTLDAWCVELVAAF